MTSRERMLAAIRREPLDRVPTDIWATPEVWTKLRDHFGDGIDVRAELGVDGMAGIAPDYVGPALPEAPPGETLDFWGMRRRTVAHAGGTYAELIHNPLAQARTVADLDAYAWPRSEWFDYSALRERAAAARQIQVVQCGYMAPFYYHNLLRGLELSLFDPVDDPAFTHALLERLCGFFYDHHRRMFEACGDLVDVAQVTDDLGCQTGPLIGLPTYREFYAPWHRRFCDLCHEFDIAVMHHDDGGCRDFLPDLLDMGIAVLNPVQHNCPGMDMAGLKADFGDRLCFHGAVDNQAVLPFGTMADVRAEVRRCIDALAADGTGYVVAPCHNLQGITPVDNILAMYDEALTYGQR